MRIQQIGVEFLPAEDRILLKVRLAERGVMRLLVTRRYLRLFWDKVIGLMSRHVGAGRVLSSEARAAVRAMQQEQVLRRADFSQPFRDGPPVAAEFARPLVLKGIRIRALAAGHWRLTLVSAEGPQVGLNVPDAMIIAMCKILRDAARRAEWNLELRMFESAPADTAKPVIH